MKFARASGILLHPTSLPGPFGIGDIGTAAYRFADLLASTGQSLWQVLPLGPTGYGDSPYQCLSVAAGNPLLISPEALIADGLLEQSDLSAHLGSTACGHHATCSPADNYYGWTIQRCTLKPKLVETSNPGRKPNVLHLRRTGEGT